MLKRLTIKNYRCFRDAEFEFGPSPSELLLGKNGSGKSTLLRVLVLLQKIITGEETKAESLFSLDDHTFKNTAEIHIGVELLFQNVTYIYQFSVGAEKETLVRNESLVIDGKHAFQRVRSKPPSTKLDVDVFTPSSGNRYVLTPEIFGIYLYTDQSIQVMREWFKKALFIGPVPSKITGESTGRTTPSLVPNCSNFADWFSSQINTQPSLATSINEHLKKHTDFNDFQNVPIGETRRLLRLVYEGQPPISFEEVSDGEKIFFLGAVVLALVEKQSLSFCLWDEPDNFLSLHEVQHFIVGLRKMGRQGTQLLVTSHHPETVGCFSPENTRVMRRDNRDSKTTLAKLEDIEVIGGDTVTALALGELYD